MREVDRLTVDEFAISLEQMMENAGRNLAVVARHRVDGDVAGRRVLVLAGSGGNGGGGLVAARHLVAAGARVSVALTVPPEALAPVTLRQYEAIRRLDVETGDVGSAELVVDALLGYGQQGSPTGEVARLIREASGARVLALDVPSGLELETGRLHDPHVRASATLTLALPKEGLRSVEAGGVTGDLYLADLSVPPPVYERLGLTYSSPFGQGPVVEVQRSPAGRTWTD
jgi:NAD(P)H-hydrate epimerase